MNIKIVDSWLREFLEIKATAEEIASNLSLTSVSVERVEKVTNDYVYDIEVTTNRPDLMSVEALAREAAASLTEEGIAAKFVEKKIKPIPSADISFPIEIENDPKLVNRIMAAVLEVNIAKSPKEISTRLEESGIRSLNNLIDVTNYVMRETGHPCHVFDFDQLNTKKMIIRASKPGETLTTLDGKQYRLTGGDIVADNGKGEIIDLLGIMGTANSVVQERTKRILFFLDNNNPQNIRSTSMSLGIRTEAAIINEKGVDPALMAKAFARGIELYQKIAEAKVVSKTLDIYPNKAKTHVIKVPLERINKVMGIIVESTKSISILQKLGFGVKKTGESLEVLVPTSRAAEVTLVEDVIEEIARVYGYHKLPSTIPFFTQVRPYSFTSNFYFEERVKNALKYFGFTETYTYSLISEDMFDGPIESAVALKNPLGEEMKYLRNSLVPSLLRVAEENKKRSEVKIFEIANIYKKNGDLLPKEVQTLSAVVKKHNASFFEVKGLLENIFDDLGIKNYKFNSREEGGAGVLIGNEKIGYVEILNNNLVDFELNFEKILEHVSLKKAYKPLAKFPSVFEDITFVLDGGVLTGEVIEEIKLQSFLIRDATLIDQFENSRTFHIIYQAPDKNLSGDEVSEIRKDIIGAIKEKFGAQVK